MDRSRVAAVIPALNEQATIAAVVTGASRYARVVVVSDGSTDATAKLAREAGAIVVEHDRPRGYDQALESGFRACRDLSVDAIVTLDADGQHDPETLATVIEALQDVPLVVGRRPRTQRLVEALFAAYTRRRYGWTDPLCGLKGYRTELYLEQGCFDDYGSIGTQLAWHAIHRGRPFTEIPVPIRERKGHPRFGAGLRANWRLWKALWRGWRRFGL